MSKVVVQSIGMSLDGFSAGAGQSMDEPLGVLGRDLMDWYLPTKIFIKHHGGGPATIREFLSARLIDELHLALRPICSSARANRFLRDWTFANSGIRWTEWFPASEPSTCSSRKAIKQEKSIWQK